MEWGEQKGKVWVGICAFFPKNGYNFYAEIINFCAKLSLGYKTHPVNRGPSFKSATEQQHIFQVCEGFSMACLTPKSSLCAVRHSLAHIKLTNSEKMHPKSSNSSRTAIVTVVMLNSSFVARFCTLT